ncbi:multicopper oxidase family protein [Piscinibacter koreensis]|uniref:Multicopper oxidase domain-containing protein n=1 Tax=Piscinibacter koreensis TaxID=2742824 RepID=A0A7Y6TYU4_9BURK|nr:multicopper oxidase domain-containing protein [Schlegelella koreensis]NUZ08436.1 multicopper oxidase domain-containing protein [Schlegelella koreensis]
MINDKRRLLLKGGSVAAALALPATRVVAAGRPEVAGGADVHIELRAGHGEAALRPGKPTSVWRYTGRLLAGDPASLQVHAGSSLGPTLRLRRGQRVRIELLNELPEATTIHWHGLHVPDDMDGHPRHAVAPGQRYIYDFTVLNRAGTYWYHAHPHGRTGPQVYRGLAGLLLIDDDEESALDLPRGAYDLSLVLQDRSFDSDNQLVYPVSESAESSMHGRMQGGGMMGRGGMAGMMARMMGVLGDELLLNGRMPQRLEVRARPYRLRLVNASNTRTYKLAWSNGTPLAVIGTDGGLLDSPQAREYLMLAPAERAEVWVDFARWAPGAAPALESLEFDGAMTMGSGRLPDGSRFEVLRFAVVGSERAAPRQPPQRLTELPAARPAIAVNARRPKVFDLTMGMMVWGVDGRSFEMLQASPEETVKLGTHEIWEFRNEGRGAMMGMVMAHSMHIHGVQFRVIGRQVMDRFAAAYRTVSGGLVDGGWKDTVLVMPGERVQVLVGFSDYSGLFLYHCHMLEHEDSGLMRNYLVKA